MQWLGVDVGGTFTDFVLYDEATGELRLLKTPSTPHDHSEGMMAGIGLLGLDLGQLARFAHGTTVATNTALERSGARMVVLVTKGHRDVLVVGRGNRTVMYNIKAEQPEPLIPRSRLIEVDERALHDGTVLRALDPAEIDGLAARLRADGIEAVAVCFLHAYANDGNERRAKDALARACPELFISTSAEVLPEYREYERFATTALNAYVAPRMRRYLAALRDRLAERGYKRPVAIMTSNGGTMASERLETSPVQSMLSGPAAGVIAATFVGEAAGFRDIITYDMGGTSTDVALIRDLRYAMSNDGRIGTLPNKVLQIDISTIGAGGGSIAAVGAGGFLTVGPRSAGASPGPVAYGRGGAEPTVTDANVVLGRLGTDRALGGEITLDRGKAAAALAALGGRLGLDATEMADGIIRIAVAKMTGVIKEISIMRGHDPRDCVLFAYGGAGPLHAAFVAAELGMRSVVVPPMPGNFSAFGLLVADVRRDFVRTRVTPTRELDAAGIRGVFREMTEEARRDLAEEGFAAAAIRVAASLDMRYLGQAFELAVPVSAELGSIDEVEEAFRRVYEQRYAHAAENPTEIVSFRLSAWGTVEKPALPRLTAAGRSLAAARRGTREVAFDARFVETPIFARDLLPLGEAFAGPAIVEESGATTVVPPGFTARLEPQGSLVLERTAQ